MTIIPTHERASERDTKGEREREREGEGERQRERKKRESLRLTPAPIPKEMCKGGRRRLPSY